MSAVVDSAEIPLAVPPTPTPCQSIQVDSVVKPNPYPSPGSSFLPPPTPQAHEFALIHPSLLPRKSTSAASGIKANNMTTTATSSTVAPAIAETIPEVQEVLLPPSPEETSNQTTPKTGLIQPPTTNGIFPPSPMEVDEPVMKPPVTQSTAAESPYQHANSLPKNNTDSLPESLFQPPLETPPFTPDSPVIMRRESNPPPSTAASNAPPLEHRNRASSASFAVSKRHLSRSSLHSNRPAPPSPAQSRRTSQAVSISSTKSGKSTSHLSGVLSPSKRASLVEPVTPSTPGTPGTASKRHSTSSISFVIKIRDFAFSKGDDRHFGRGPDAPGRRKSTSSNISNDSESGGFFGKRNSGWGFKWSALSGRFSWGFGSPSGSPSATTPSEERDSPMGSPRKARRKSGLSNGYGYFGYDDDSDDDDPQGDDGYTPSKQDFDRNFEGEDPSVFAYPVNSGSVHPATYASSSSSSSYASSNNLHDDPHPDEPAYAQAGYSYGYDADSPLRCGYYRALYSFEPEGTAEMALEEDQIVKIVGRGGGVGWAVAVNEKAIAAGAGPGAGGGSIHALVPESYLEWVRPLEEDVYDPDEGDTPKTA